MLFVLLLTILGNPHHVIVPRQVTGVALSRAVRSGAPALKVTWTTPQSDMSITRYRVRHRKSGTKDWTSRTVSGSPPPTVAYLEGLSLGAAYEVQLQAESAIGSGNFSEVQTATAFDGEEVCMCCVRVQGKSVWYKFNIMSRFFHCYHMIHGQMFAVQFM